MSEVVAEPGHLTHARQLHQRGVAESSALRPVAAVKHLRAALFALDQVADGSAEVITLRAQILITLAKAESELHGVSSGLAVLDDVEGLLRVSPQPGVLVALCNQRGVLNIRSGKLRRAIAEFDEAEQWFAEAPALERANVLLNRASAAMMLGDLRSARDDLERCAAVAERGELPLLRYMSVHNLGYLRFLLGDLPGALRTMQAAGSLGIEIKGIALLDRARVLAEAGLSVSADETLAEAASIFSRDRMSQDLAEAELARAECALVRGELSDARRLAARSRDRFRRRGNQSWRRYAELVLLQGDLAAGRPGTRLVEPAAKLRSEFEQEGLRIAARAAGLIATEAHLAAHDVGGAAQTLGSLNAPSTRDPITSRLHFRYVKARLDEAQGDSRAAARQVRAGLRDLAAYQASFGSIDLQTASAIHGRHLAELDLSLALKSDRPTAVFAAAERVRAVSARLPTVEPPADEHAAELLSELRQVVESLRAVERDHEASAPLLRRRRDLEQRIASRRWTVAGTGAVSRTATMDQVRTALAGTESVLVTYLQVQEQLHAIVIGQGRTRMHNLGPSAESIEHIRRVRADLDVLAYPRMPPPLAAAIRNSLARSLTQLDAALVTPLRLRGRRLVISSTGSLGQLPWGLLPSLRGVPVVVVPSASAWLTASAAGSRPGTSVVALAGPDLARAAHEVGGIAGCHPGATVLTGAAADCGALKAALAQGAVVHVAAHGVHQTENPLFSSLRLADGPMFAHELDQTARTPDHVILSACELGLATVRPGDEALGLTSVLLHLGTRSVVAGVARVGDDLAADTMIEYHRRLAKGADSASALADAISQQADPVPFVCFGSSWSRPS